MAYMFLCWHCPQHTYVGKADCSEDDLNNAEYEGDSYGMKPKPWLKSCPEKEQCMENWLGNVTFCIWFWNVSFCNLIWKCYFWNLIWKCYVLHLIWKCNFLQSDLEMFFFAILCHQSFELSLLWPTWTWSPPSHLKFSSGLNFFLRLILPNNVHWICSFSQRAFSGRKKDIHRLEGLD